MKGSAGGIMGDSFVPSASPLASVFRSCFGSSPSNDLCRSVKGAVLSRALCMNTQAKYHDLVHTLSAATS
eukprot:CAMPEP_0113593722 /NCGR_PEP_ID=MMETSP0015_2-20120614/38623_1 /TAXON_ID=2838 /ORGANISM="Odontella" /LENGTH=69 /DNA_ID=CAMNT_0000500527 /DNA_START=183 /DNA_END=392 /DNA_ORIENTATION=- /assembly_acc=CAM_ASM_000160